MTEDIKPSRHPSSAEIDIAKLQERYVALKDDVTDVKTAILDIKDLMVTNHSQLLAVFNQHKLEDAIVHQRVLQIDTHLTATDSRISEMQSESRRDPVTFWTAVSAGAVAVGGAVAAVFGGKP